MTHGRHSSMGDSGQRRSHNDQRPPVGSAARGDSLPPGLLSMTRKMSSSLKACVERSIGYALMPFRRDIRRVAVHLSDNNGARGGPDKHCRIDVWLAGVGRVRVEDFHTSIFAAVNRAADRVGHTVSRKLSRRRTRALRARTQAKRQHGGQVDPTGAAGASRADCASEQEAS